jgi:hypothetical protein
VLTTDNRVRMQQVGTVQRAKSQRPEQGPISSLAEALEALFKRKGMRELDAELERWGFQAEAYSPECYRAVVYFAESAVAHLYVERDNWGDNWCLLRRGNEFAPVLPWAKACHGNRMGGSGQTLKALRAMLEKLFEKVGAEVQA